MNLSRRHLLKITSGAIMMAAVPVEIKPAPMPDIPPINPFPKSDIAASLMVDWEEVSERMPLIKPPLAVAKGDDIYLDFGEPVYFNELKTCSGRVWLVLWRGDTMLMRIDTGIDCVTAGAELTITTVEPGGQHDHKTDA